MKRQTTTTTSAKTKTTENPFDTGVSDGLAGRTQRANPYRYGTIHWARWLSGWNWANTPAKRKAA